MAEEIKVTKDYLNRVVDLGNQAAPRLEKLAQQESQLSQLAKTAADQMAEAGIIKAEAKQDVENDLNQGGIPKIAEAFDFVMQHVGVPANSMGKQASADAHNAETETADQAWERHFGIRR